MRILPFLVAAHLLLLADDRGLAPRARVSDYPAHQTGAAGAIGALAVPAQKVEKMLSADIAKHYIVLEVAVYPADGRTIDLDRVDFKLKVGDQTAFAEGPREVTAPWKERKQPSNSPVTVVTDTGVVYSRGSDPVNGRRSGWEVYQGVGVTNDPRARPADPPPPDQRGIEDRVRVVMLPEGKTTAPVAGYIFFPKERLKSQKGGVMELHWSNDGASIMLRIV